MSPFAQVAWALAAASLFGVVARLLRQPLLVGYLFAGLALGALGYLSDVELLRGLGQVGITLLLFLVGIEMNPRELPTIGRVALATGIGQILFTSIVGFFIVSLLGFGTLSALYIALALTFSSTIIIVKLLSEKRDLGSLYGKIAVGFLLVQDFVAILILILLSGFNGGDSLYQSLALVLIKGLILIGAVYYLSQNLIPKLFDKLSTSQELLYVVSIAWALAFASFVASPLVGFSIEIGGFLAGLSLSQSIEHLQIASRIRPLRDFFITIFFLVLGSQLAVSSLGAVALPALILSAFVLIGNPIIVLAVMGFMHYTKRTAFLASVTVAQISEFSFILVAMGASLGHIGSPEIALVTLVGVITMTLSTYLILYSHAVYEKIEPLLGIFERKKTRESAFRQKREIKDHIVLIGCHRTGSALLPTLSKREEELLIADFNPEVVSQLSTEGYEAIFGDVSDAETIELLNLEEAKLVISTVNSLEDDLILLEKVRLLKNPPPVILVASYPQEALKLYEAGAAYVVVPRIVGGEHIAHVLGSHGFDREYFEKLRDRHFDRLARERYY